MCTCTQQSHLLFTGPWSFLEALVMYQMIFLIVRCIPVTFVCSHDSLWWDTHTAVVVWGGQPRTKICGIQAAVKMHRSSDVTSWQCTVFGLVYCTYCICHIWHCISQMYCIWVDFIAKPSGTQLAVAFDKMIRNRSKMKWTSSKCKADETKRPGSWQTMCRPLRWADYAPIVFGHFLTDYKSMEHMMIQEDNEQHVDYDNVKPGKCISGRDQIKP